MNQTVDGQQWLVLINQDTRRMMSTREVQTEVQAGVLPRETLVWRAGMSAWQSISSIAELGMANARPTVPRAKATVGWDAALVPTPRTHAPGHDHPAEREHAGHAHAHAPARTQVNGAQLMLELVATGAAVLLIVLITSYTLYAGGAFRAGSDSNGEGNHDAAAEAKTAAH